MKFVHSAAIGSGSVAGVAFALVVGGCTSSNGGSLGADQFYNGGSADSGTPSTGTMTSSSTPPSTVMTSSAADAAAEAAAVPGEAVRPAYEFKTSAQLKAAVVACFGTGVTTVKQTMIESITAKDGGAGFLSPSDFAANDDVIAKQIVIFDGDPSIARTGVRNDTVSLPVLAALQNVGNVVGDNCAAQQAANTMCVCGDSSSAAAMLARCLPDVDPMSYMNLVGVLATACAKDPASAIASLVASTTFGAQ